MRGHYYHFYNRGARRLTIFIEPDNYLFAIGKFKKYCREMELAPIVYCFMPKHYHFLIQQDGENAAGLLPQYLFNTYTKAFNNRYEQSGTLFEGHYHSEFIEKEHHLLHLCRYIQANPVKDGLESHPENWPFSN